MKNEIVACSEENRTRDLKGEIDRLTNTLSLFEPYDPQYKMVSEELERLKKLQIEEKKVTSDTVSKIVPSLIFVGAFLGNVALQVLGLYVTRTDQPLWTKFKI